MCSRFHGITCHCFDCKRKNKLGKLAWRLSTAMLQATKDGKHIRADRLCNILEKVNNERSRLQDMHANYRRQLIAA